MKKNLISITAFTLVGLYVLLSIVIFGACLIIKIPLIYGIITSALVLIIQFLLSPFLTDLTMKWFYKIDFDFTIPEYLKEFINNICQQENIKTPKIGVINDGTPNAFTYGRIKNDARLVITRGILEMLTEEEVKAVVGHEFGHIIHMDMLFMTVAQFVPLVLYFIYENISKSDNSDNDNSNSNSQIIAIIAYILYIISQYIILWLSRTREYYADQYSVEITKNPNSLASALVKIGFGLSIGLKNNINNLSDKNNTERIHSVKDVGALGIFDAKTSKSLIVSTNNNLDDITSIKNAMKWEMWNPWAFIYELKSTHPLISKRLLEISKYSNLYNQKPFIVFDLEKKETYIDDFLIEVIIKYSPMLTFILTLLICIVNLKTKYVFTYIGIGGIITLALSYIGFLRSHKPGYKKTNVKELLGEVKVSGITSISCELEGKIIGKGDPGCIFNEDFVLQDETGIILLDYNQPMFLLNKIFALFKSHKYIDNTIKVKGWYRRSPVPFVEIFEMQIDGKIKKIFTYPLTKIIYLLLLIICIILIVKGIV